eukprot:XP_001699508.1 predicted protein [Chlamydomonas reinhardtii]
MGVRRTEDTLVHVQWYERTAEGRAAEPVDDVIVFPGEAMLEKIPGQRAVVLKFPEDKERNMFFWWVVRGASLVLWMLSAHNPHRLQEGGAAEDDEALVAAFNTALHQPGVMMGQGSSVGQMPAAPAQTPGSTAAVNAQGNRRRAVAAPGPSLAEVLRPEALMPVLRDPSVLAELAPHLPEQHRTMEALEALAHSPQFQQQLSTFSDALQTGQLDLSQFGLRAAGTP